MMRTVSMSVVGLVLGGLSTQLSGQSPADAALQVDHIFSQWDSVDRPGCAVGVAQHGLTVLSRAYGMADLAILLALAAYGFWVSLAGQPLFKDMLAERQAA